MNAMVFIFRFIVWILVLTLESVVGLPWISLYLAGEWILSLSPQTTLLSLVVMSVVVSAVYSLPLSFIAILIILIWQTLLRTRKNTWQRWVAYWVCALLIGFFARVPLNTLVIMSSVVSFILFYKFSGGRIVKHSWQATKLTRSSDI